MIRDQYKERAPSKPITSEMLAKGGTEHGHQRAFMNELRLWSQVVFDATFAIPNGRKRDRIDAGMLKAEGVKAGVPDIFVSWPQRFNLMIAPQAFIWVNAAGLFIEMKKPVSGVVGKKQEPWHIGLVQRGYAVAVAYDYTEAINVTRYYFGQLPATHCIAARFTRQTG